MNNLNHPVGIRGSLLVASACLAVLLVGGCDCDCFDGVFGGTSSVSSEKAPSEATTSNATAALEETSDSSESIILGADRAVDGDADLSLVQRETFASAHASR